MYKLPQQLLEVLINYLGTQRFSDVFQLIDALRRLEKDESVEGGPTLVKENSAK